MALTYGQYLGLFWVSIVASLASLVGSGMIVSHAWKRHFRKKARERESSGSGSRSRSRNGSGSRNGNAGIFSVLSIFRRGSVGNKDSESPSVLENNHLPSASATNDLPLSDDQPISLQQRLILSLSINDVFSSLNTMTVLLMMPKGTPAHPWALGNASTCTISGFLTMMLFLTTTCYNCCLSMYYLFTVRYGYSEQSFGPYKYWAMHIGTWLVAVSFGILGIVFDGYNPKIITNICFLDTCSIEHMATTRTSCSDSEADVLAGGYIIFVAVLALISIIATALVYLHVRRKITGNKPTNTNTNSDGSSNGRTGILSLSGNSNNNNSMALYRNVPADVARARLRLISSQAVGYTIVYLNLLIWQSVLIILSFGEEWAYFEAEGQLGWFYMLQLLSWIFIPGQGVLNCIVYTRPKYLKWRQAFPNANRFWIAYNAWQMKDPPTRSQLLAAASSATATGKISSSQPNNNSNNNNNTSTSTSSQKRSRRAGRKPQRNGSRSGSNNNNNNNNHNNIGTTTRTMKDSDDRQKKEEEEEEEEENEYNAKETRGNTVRTSASGDLFCIAESGEDLDKGEDGMVQNPPPVYMEPHGHGGNKNAADRLRQWMQQEEEDDQRRLASILSSQGVTAAPAGGAMMSPSLSKKKLKLSSSSSTSLKVGMDGSIMESQITSSHDNNV